MTVEELDRVSEALGGEPPASIDSGEKSGSMDWARSLAEEFGVTPGEPRHGEVALRWDVADDAIPLLREQTEGSEYIGTLHGHFCVFNRWTEIRSFLEGHFLERIAPGACKKTFAENRQGMRCLLNHGRDPQFGMKPLGPINELEEDKTGGRYEVGMLDTSLNRDLLPALKQVPSLYGASFRFEVMREEVQTNPKRSDANPKGIEERTITEMRVREFGPVTFPAYADASAGARSLNDWWAHMDLEAFRGAHPDAFPMSLAQVLTAMNLRGGTDLSQVRVPSTSPEAEDPERAEWDATHEAAPSSGAPGAPPEESASPSDPRVQPTRLTGAARRPLRSQRKEEGPQWKL